MCQCRCQASRFSGELQEIGTGYQQLTGAISCVAFDHCHLALLLYINELTWLNPVQIEVTGRPSEEVIQSSVNVTSDDKWPDHHHMTQEYPRVAID